MTKTQMKIAVAKDVIAQIKQHHYEVEIGTYVSGLPYNRSGDLQKILRKKDWGPCTVCAIGSTFLSTVRLFNKFVMKDGDISVAAMKRKLGEIFSRQERKELEASFENDNGTGYLQGWRKRLKEGYREFLDSMNSTDRLIWLMEIIIEHGTFSLKLAETKAWEEHLIPLRKRWNKLASN